MTPGRKSKWNFERIAHEFNLGRKTHEARVDASEVRKDIRRHEQLFARLTRHVAMPGIAYGHLRLVLAGSMTEEQIIGGWPSPADVPPLRTFSPSKDYEPRLPAWFRRAVRDWLAMLERVAKHPPPPLAPVGRDRREEVSLSLYLMANCLQDERYIWLMRRVQRIWRVKRYLREPEAWYSWLRQQQDRAVEQLFPRGASWRQASDRFESYGQGGGLGWVKPLDNRNIRGDLARESYGLPLLDYKSDLKQLVRLAGGDPGNDLWQDWVEALLWELRPRPTPGLDWEPQDALLLGSEFLCPIWGTEGRDIPHPPPRQPRVVTERAPRGEVRLNIAVPSRWVSLASFPADLRDDVLHAILRVWGAHREPLTHTRRLAYLAGLLSTSHVERDTEHLLEDLWEVREAELEALSIWEQEAVQRETVRRARDAQRKRSQRARKRLQA